MKSQISIEIPSLLFSESFVSNEIEVWSLVIGTVCKGNNYDICYTEDDFMVGGSHLNTSNSIIILRQ